MSTVLITGANRGIGLALAAEFARRGHTVLATAREPAKATALAETGAECFALDVADPASIAAFAKALGQRPIDYLIHNAGLGDRAALGNLDFARFQQLLDVNTLAPLRLTEVLTDHVAASERKMIAAISSQLGSLAITDNGAGLAYRVSKAALNMGLRAAAITLRERGISLLALHPGWVKTDMGGSAAPVSPEDSARGLFDVITGAAPLGELRFLDWQGRTLAW